MKYYAVTREAFISSRHKKRQKEYTDRDLIKIYNNCTNIGDILVFKSLEDARNHVLLKEKKDREDSRSIPDLDYQQHSIIYEVESEQNLGFVDYKEYLPDSCGKNTTSIPSPKNIAYTPCNNFTKPTAAMHYDKEYYFDTDVGKIYDRVYKLTTKYLTNNTNDSKNRALIALQKALIYPKPTFSKATVLENFSKVLQETDKAIIGKHRTPAWQRYLANVLSVIMVLPACARILSSYIKYNTFKFWEPQSQQLVSELYRLVQK